MKVNGVLMSLRDQSAGLASPILINALGLPREEVERHLLYCSDYGLATWTRKNDGSGLAVITGRGLDYLSRQGL
jgi:hypothetical protein